MNVVTAVFYIAVAVLEVGLDLAPMQPPYGVTSPRGTGLCVAKTRTFLHPVGKLGNLQHTTGAYSERVQSGSWEIMQS